MSLRGNSYNVYKISSDGNENSLKTEYTNKKRCKKRKPRYNIKFSLLIREIRELSKKKERDNKNNL